MKEKSNMPCDKSYYNRREEGKVVRVSRKITFRKGLR
jgi:hypothetical protein